MYRKTTAKCITDSKHNLTGFTCSQLLLLSYFHYQTFYKPLKFLKLHLHHLQNKPEHGSNAKLLRNIIHYSNFLIFLQVFSRENNRANIPEPTITFYALSEQCLVRPRKYKYFPRTYFFLNNKDIRPPCSLTQQKNGNTNNSHQKNGNTNNSHQKNGNTNNSHQKSGNTNNSHQKNAILSTLTRRMAILTTLTRRMQY